MFCMTHSEDVCQLLLSDGQKKQQLKDDWQSQEIVLGVLLSSVKVEV